MSSSSVSTRQFDSLEIHALPLTTYKKPTAAPEAIHSNALAALRRYLPVSLPLYRRLQFGRFFEATTLLTNLSLSDQQSSDVPAASKDKPWLIAFVDRSCRPETEVWLYCSWESHDTDTNASTDGKEMKLMRNLLQAMKDLAVPESIHQDILNAKATDIDSNSTDSVGLSRSDYAAHMLDVEIMLWGSIHERTLPILQRLGVADGERFKTAAVPNLMFTWDVDALAVSKELPENVRWGELESRHFPIVRSRTQIPRQDRTLAVLPNLGIFPASSEAPNSQLDPLAWVFVGLDGSLTTLHVEPEWRGKGLAKAITAKLFREKMGMFWERGLTKWTHGYVIRGNKESEGMCRSLGGRSEWDVYWVRVDLGAV